MLTRNRILFAVVVLAAGLAVAALSAKGPPPRKLTHAVDAKSHGQVKPTQLASWLIEGRRDFTVIDLRAPDDFGRGHVRGAVNCGHCHANAAEGRAAVEKGDFVDLSKKLVVYTATGKEPVELPKVLAQNPNLLLLEGGYQAWQEQVLAKVSFEGVTDPERLNELARKEAVRAYFAGERPSSAPAVLPTAPIRRDNAHKPAAAREGC
ncbi:MAG: rhodanese-like domain-containing protein [Myxococcota bacterium]